MSTTSSVPAEADAALELLKGLELNASQAARALGVERAVVPTWVNRGVGFPAAVRTAGRSTYYPAAEIARWALRRASLDVDLDAFLLSACLDALDNVAGTPAADRLDLLAVLLLVAAHAEADLAETGSEELGRRLQEETPELWHLCAPDLADLAARHSAREWDVLTRLAAILAEHSYTPAHDYLRLRAVSTRRHAGRGEQPLPDAHTCAFLTALSSWAADGGWGPPVVLRGTGASLHWASLAVADVPELAARVVDSTDGDPRASRGFRRLQSLLDPETLYGTPADDVGAVAGADHLLTLPLTDGPTDPAGRLADHLTRIEDVLLDTGPGQTVLVLGRRDVLVDPVGDVAAGTEGGRLKRELYTSGAVRAAVVLGPARTSTASGQALAVLVLRRPEDSSGGQDPYLLVADLSGQELTPGDATSSAGKVVDDVTTYLAATVMSRHTQQFGDVVQARAFVDRGVHHAPDRTVRLRAPEDPEQLLAAAHAAARTLEGLSRPLLPTPLGWDLAVVDRDGTGRHLPPRTRTLGERVRAGRRSRGEELRNLAGHRLRHEDIAEPAGTAEAPPAARPVLGPAELRGERPLGSRTIALQVLAQHYPSVRLTEPGDVVVLDGPDPGVLVDRAGSSVVESPCAVLRLPRPHRGADPASSSEVLAELLRAGLEAQARQGRPRPSWRHVRLPESLGFEGTYDDALRRLGELEQELRDRLQDVEDLRRTVRRGVHARVLKFPADARD